MKPLGTIEQELAACVAAFEGVEVGALVWCCHHEILVKHLTEPAQVRIDYIMSDKPERERARRLHEFRPIRGELPAKCQAAYAEWQAAYAKVRAAYAELQAADAKVRAAYAEYQAAYAEWQAAYAKVRAADAEWQAAYAKWQADPAVLALHKAEVPDSAWDGNTIFSGGVER